MKKLKAKSSYKFIFRSALVLSNVARNLLVGFFGLLLNYILIHLHSKSVLNDYVFFITITNLFLTFTNWGGKFFNNKEISQHPNKIKLIVSDLISSKILLIPIASAVLFFLQMDVQTKLLLFGFLFLKSFTSIFDSLIQFKKKFIIAFFIEFALYFSFLVIVFYNSSVINSKTFLILFVSFEFIKFFTYLLLTKNEISFHFSFPNAITILKKSTYFFSFTLGGFLTSKADLYIVGILSDKSLLSNYFIITSLVSLSLVLFATFINTFETNIYRFNFKLFKKFERFSQLFGLLFSTVATFFFYFITSYFYEMKLDAFFCFLFLINLFTFALLNFELYRFTKLEKQKIILIAMLFSGCLTCFLSFILIPLYSINGAFLSNTIGVIFNYIILKIYFVKFCSNEV